MTIVAFHTNVLCLRGSSVAVYDYAHYNETLLGNTSIIVAPNCDSHDAKAFAHFKSRFSIVLYDSNDHMNELMKILKVDVFYTLTFGSKTYLPSNVKKTAVHCVFDMDQPFGDVYAGVSETIARKFNKWLFVPHIVSLEIEPVKRLELRKNFRKQLGIPQDSIVFGRYGGYDTFNLEWVPHYINQIVHETDIHFIFMGTLEFGNHPQLHFLPTTADMSFKTSFICASDAHLECGYLGHTFGLAMAEFNVLGKPIICYGDMNRLNNKAHLDILGKECLKFSDPNEFVDILTNFKPYEAKNCYTRFNPKTVMDTFEKVFLL